MSSFPGRIIAIIGIVAVSAACTGATTAETGSPQGGGPSPVAGQTASAGQGSGDGTSLVAAAAAVTDACTLMPMDLAATIVPDASAPQSQQFPPYKCTVSNGTSVLEITIAAYDAVDPLVPNDPVAGLGAAAYLQKQTPDNAYLKVILDPNGGAVYIEVAGHDGKDHGDDAIAVAQRVLAALS